MAEACRVYVIMEASLQVLARFILLRTLHLKTIRAKYMTCFCFHKRNRNNNILRLFTRCLEGLFMAFPYLARYDRELTC
uniref:Putative secreted protein n=1 Tax=Ixodes ricinus TaxID=34613 RepID=A0A6B0TVB6_IXORI